MLGDNSRLSNESHHLPLDTKLTPSTNHISTINDPSNISQNKYSSTKLTKNQKIKQMKNKLGTMEKNQQQIQQKLGSYVGILQKELKKKEENNKQLQQSVRQLRKEIQQSKMDVEVLLNYLAKKKPLPNNQIINNKPKSPIKNRIYIVSKGKSKSPTQKQDKKSPMLRKNKFFLK